MARKTQRNGRTKELLPLEIIEDRVVILLLSRLILSPENPDQENHSQQVVTKVMTIAPSKPKY